MNATHRWLFCGFLVCLVVCTGCRSPYRSDQGALLGGLTGAGVGAVIGDAVDQPLAGTAIGAGVGALTGAVIGDNLDQIEAENRAAIEARLASVEGRMSTWRADSELSRLNGHASTEPFALSRETLEVLGLARDVSEASGGGFDVTARPLVALWGFGAGARAPGEAPTPEEIAAARARVGYRLLDLDPAAGTARKAQTDLECDLSAIAKGYGVDEVVSALEGLGWTDLFVEVGGEVSVRGQRPGGGAWRVGIEKPAGALPRAE